MGDNEDGALQVWFMPKVPGAVFDHPVKDIEEGGHTVGVLRLYNKFLIDQGHLVDRLGAGGVAVWSAVPTPGEIVDEVHAWLEVDTPDK